MGTKLISRDILWDSPNAMGNSGIFIGEDGLIRGIYIYSGIFCEWIMG